MAYFSNSDDGMAFEARFCAHCAHKPKSDDEACPIVTAHVCYQGGSGDAQAVLDLLVYRNFRDLDKGCAMFVERPGGVPWE